MSHLLVITNPSLIAGYHLAGVEAFKAETPERAADLIKSWLYDAEPALVAIDENLLAGLQPDFLRRVNASDIHLIGIPSPSTLPSSDYLKREENSERQQRIEKMVQQAVGFHITFKGNNHE